MNTVDLLTHDPKFSFTTLYVHIIESPSPEDLLDGRTEGSTLRESLRLADIPLSYNLATNRAMFDAAMTARVRDGMAQHGRYPLLHFSMHGSQQNGICLTDGEAVSWESLEDAIRALEPLTGGGLIVCLSSCYGAFARQMAHSSAKPPYSLLVGHPGELDWADGAVAFTALYHRFFKGVPHFWIAVEAMKVASGDGEFLYSIGLEERMAWQSILKPYTPPLIG